MNDRHRMWPSQNLRRVCCLVLLTGSVSTSFGQTNTLPPPRQNQPNQFQPRQAQPRQTQPRRPAGIPESLPPPANRIADSGALRPEYEGEIVADVRVSGNRVIDPQRFFQVIKTRRGREFRSQIIQEDVRRLHKENLVRDVQTLVQRVPEGLILTFQIVERPTIEYVRFVGNRYFADAYLIKKADIKRGDSLNAFTVEDARRRLEEFYHSKGYTKTKVLTFEGDKIEHRGVIFYVAEGQKERIGKVRFIGNDSGVVSDGRLKTQVKSKPGILYLFGGLVNKESIEEDVEKLTAYYRGLGFFQARIGRSLEYDASGKWLYLTFVIDEGPRYKIRSVSIEGNTQFDQQELLDHLKIRPNEFFNLARMKGDQNSLLSLYGGQGFVYADVKADPRFLEEPGYLDLVYRIQEGKQFYVGKINIHFDGDYPHTKKKVVLDRLSFRTGQLIDMNLVRASENRLRRSQLFETNPALGAVPRIEFGEPELFGNVPKTYRGQSPSGISPRTMR